MKRFPVFEGLSAWLQPLSFEEFLQTYWGKAVYFAPNALGDRVSDILSIEEFEFTIAGIHKPNEGWLHLSNNGFKRLPDSLIDADGLLKMQKIRAAFAKGDSLYLTKGEKIFPALMQISRGMQVELFNHAMLMQKPVSAHVFLTPPNSQAFPVHRDEHASFILQIEGSKHWTVYEPIGSLSDSKEDSMVKGPVDAQTLSKLQPKEIKLHAGDMLYVPEWWPHDVRSSDEYSLHVTVRLHPLRYSDILESVFATDWKLQQGIDTTEVRSHKTLLGSLLKVMNTPATMQRFETNFNEFVRTYLVPDKVLPGDSLRQALLLPTLRLQTLLVRPEGNKCVVNRESNDVCIFFPGGTLRGPEQVAHIFEFVSRENQFRPVDLPDIPGVDYDKLEFAKTMVAEGLLNIVSKEKKAVSRAQIGILQ